MPFIQVPPDSTGKLVDTITVTSSQHRQVMVVGDPASTAGLAPVTSSAGVLTNISSGIVTLSSGGVTQVLTSGPLQVLTSGATVLSSAGVTQVLTSGPLSVLTSGPLLLSSAGVTQVLTSGTFVVASASSGVVQTLSSGLPVLSSAGVTQALLVTTSGVNIYTTGGVYADITRGQSLTFIAVTVSCSGGKQLVAASGSNKVKVTSYLIITSSATNVTWQSSNTALSGQLFLSSNGGVALAGSAGAWLLETSAAGNLVLNVNDASYVTGHVAYFYEV